MLPSGVARKLAHDAAILPRIRLLADGVTNIVRGDGVFERRPTRKEKRACLPTGPFSFSDPPSRA